jgi:sirohydrochlorin ferrochelatase
MSLANAPLVLAAHGSTDPRFASTMTSLASQLAAARPALDVRIGYLDHGPPTLADVSGEGCVIVPALLTNGYHVHIDIPANAGGAVIARSLGPDRRLAVVMADRLRAAGWRGQAPVVVAAAGSVDDQALSDARVAAAALSNELNAPVTAAFIGPGEPRLRDLSPAAVVPYLIAPGAFFDLVTRCGASIVAAPLGADPLVAAILLDRYDQAIRRVSAQDYEPVPAIAPGHS